MQSVAGDYIANVCYLINLDFIIFKHIFSDLGSYLTSVKWAEKRRLDFWHAAGTGIYSEPDRNCNVRKSCPPCLFLRTVSWFLFMYPSLHHVPLRLIALYHLVILILLAISAPLLPRFAAKISSPDDIVGKEVKILGCRPISSPYGTDLFCGRVSTVAMLFKV